MARLSWVLILTAGGLAFASPAHAQLLTPTPNTAYAADINTPANFTQRSVVLPAIPVTASVGGRCGFAAGNAPTGSRNFPNFDTLGLFAEFAFKLDCTGAFRVGVLSTSGGLVTSGAVPTGYTNKAPYDVGLSLQSDSGTVTATSACRASELVSAGSPTSMCSPQFLAAGLNFSGVASTSSGLRVSGAATNLSTIQTIRVKANAYAGSDILTAGDYKDTLTVTVSTAP